MNIHSKKDINEGRSMLEMLGVLAVAALLVIGAVWGISKLLDNHKANTILSDVSRYHLTLEELKEKFDEYGDALPTDFKAEAAYRYDAHDTADNFWFITVESVQKSVCQTLLGRARIEEGNYRLSGYVMGFYDEERLFRLYKGDIEECEEENVMTFLIGDNVCDGECPEETTCHFGMCCEYGLRCGSNCCEAGQDCCAGECIEKVECPEYQRYDSNACECRCAKDNGGVQLESDGKGGCKCPTDPNGRRMNMKNSFCTCADAGFTYVSGKCTRMDCRDGTTGNTFNCYIDNHMCGVNCDSTGNNCQRGICHAEDCGSYEYVDLAKDPDHPNKGYANFYDYRCKKKEGDFSCYAEYHTLRDWTCYNKDGRNCMNISGGTQKGVCDESECAVFKDSSGSDASLIPAQGLCRFGADDYECYRVGNKWNCFKNFNSCGKSCEDPSNCGTCKTQNTCNDGWTWNETNKRCENNNTYCVTDVRYADGYRQYCYSKSDNTKCSVYVRSFTNNLWHSGDCFDQGCSSYNYNGQAMEFGAVTPDTWGCVADKMGCYTVGGTSVYCYYNGTACGTECNFLGQNCKRVYLPQCATEGHCPQSGYDMTKNPCTCDGNVSSGLVKVKDANDNEIEEYHDFCCPAGNTYTNGGCAII